MQEFDKVIENLINYSFKLKSGDKVVLEASGKETKLFALYFSTLAAEKGIETEIWFRTKKQVKKFWNNISAEQAKIIANRDLNILKKSKAYLRVSGFSMDKAGICEKGFNIFKTIYFKTVHTNYRVNNMEWCILGFPSRENAKEAHMSLKEYKNFVLQTTSFDYSKMAKAMNKLKEEMEKTDKVHIIAPNTDLTLSIKNQPIIPCVGEKNLPDGEIYCGPIKNSVNGKITYNARSFEAGSEFKNVCFEIKNGKIIKATADGKNEEINKVLDIDKQARFFGEFAIGVNPYVFKPVGNTLFDEKICGSIHLTPGCCYEDSPNGNISALHWDLVLVLKKEYGGGEIWFDDKLIQKDGIFVPKSLKCLNPENLKK